MKKTTAPEALAKVEQIASAYKGRADMLIQVLKDIQAVTNNTLNEDAAYLIANILGVPLVRVYEVATFYAFFGMKQRGQYVIRMCKSAPCHVKGAKEVLAAFETELGMKKGGTTQDGMFTLETCECLGICDQAPAALINEKVYGNLTPEKVKAVIADYRKGGCK